MSEAWAIAIFGILITVLTGAVGGIALLLWRHIDQCKCVHSKLAEISADVKRIQEDIGTHESGMRGNIHEQGNTISWFGGCLWVIAEKLKIDLPKLNK